MNKIPEKYSPTFWIKRNVTQDPVESIFFKELYDLYKSHIVELQVIPSSKKAFSQELRDIYKQHIQDHKVQIVNRNGILIQGVKYTCAK